MIQIKVQIMAPRAVAIRITQFAAAQHLRRAHLQRVCGRKRTKLIIVHIRFVVHPQCPTTRGAFSDERAPLSKTKGQFSLQLGASPTNRARRRPLARAVEMKEPGERPPAPRPNNGLAIRRTFGERPRTSKHRPARGLGQPAPKSRVPVAGRQRGT